MFTRRGRDANGGEGQVGGTSTPAPGKHTLTEALGVVQPKIGEAAGAGGAAAPAGAPASMSDMATLAIENKGSGRPVDPGVRAKVEPHLGADLSGARVHDDPVAREATTAMGARAFAHGADVFVGQGERDTDLGLMAHELTHVVQQGAAGAATTQPKVAVGGADSPAEAQADAVAARVTGGAAPTALPVAAAPLGVVQRAPAKPAITDPFVLGLQTKLAAGNKAGAFADLVALNRSRAGDAKVRDGIKQFQTAGQLTVAEALRALVIVEFGPDGSGATAWPVAVRNWVDGVGDGVFAVTLASVPAGRDAIQELAISTAGLKANGPGLRGEYQALFDAKWTTSAEPTDFDPGLPSKGPRNQRARKIFDELYKEARFKTGYDTDAPAGFRNFCDTYGGPTSLNIVASPRLETFRAGFGGAPIAAATTADAGYTAFITAITPMLAKLDAADHAVLEAEPQRWQTLYEGKLHGSAPDVIRDFLSVVGGAAPAAPRAKSPLSAPPPVVAPPAPKPPKGPAPAPGTPAAPNAAEQAWLNSITIAGPAAAVNVEDRSTDIDFNIRSTNPNPSLVVEREVQVSPAAQAMNGTDQSREVWPVGSKSQPHTATIDPTTTAPTGITNVVAELTMPPHGAHFPAKKSAPVVVHDKRIDMVKRDVKPGLSFNEFDRYVNPTTPALTYYGGQLTVRVDPSLPTANPGLNLFVSGDIKKGGAAVPGGTFAPTPFRAGTSWFRLGELLLQQAPGGAAGAKDTFELRMRYQIGPAGAPFHTPAPTVFHVHHGALHAAPTAADTALLTRDKTELNKPGAAAAPAGNARATVLEFLKFPPATLNADQQANCKRVAAAVTAGTVPLLPMFIRSDSAAQVTAAGGDPATKVAYALGSLAPADLMIERPGWAGWQAWRGPAIYINRTPDPLKLAATRSIEEMAMFAAHEAIHSVDDPPPGWMAGTPDAFYRYRMEFRAYWVDGRYSALSTDRDDSLSFGPKSPRANAIFQHIYSSYDYTKTGYDGDAGGFREKVDNYLYPDGINLIASAHLAALKTAVRNSAGTFAVRHARVSAALAACNATDRAEITGNRAWRDDVEANFTTAPEPVPGAAPPRNEPARDQIKRLLKIPM